MKHKKPTHLRKVSGFTLVEVIISIAVLSLICAIVLRLFVLSNDVSKQARISDLAANSAMNAVEICRAYDNPNQLLQDAAFEGSEVKQDAVVTLSQYFTQDWVRIPGLASDTLTTEAIYQMTLTLAPVGEPMIASTGLGAGAEDGRTVSQLYNIGVRVQKIKDYNVDMNPIINYETGQYYVYKE